MSSVAHSWSTLASATLGVCVSIVLYYRRCIMAVGRDTQGQAAGVSGRGGLLKEWLRVKG